MKYIGDLFKNYYIDGSFFNHITKVDHLNNIDILFDDFRTEWKDLTYYSNAWIVDGIKDKEFLE